MNCTLFLILAGIALEKPEIDAKCKQSLDDSIENYRKGEYRSAESAIEMAAILSKEFDPSDPRRVRVLIESARVNGKLGRFQTSLRLLDDADAILRKSPALKAEFEARSQVVRAEMFWQLGRIKDARPQADKAYIEQVKIRGTEHIETVEALDALELANSNDGRKSLEIREKLFGKGHPNCAAGHLLIARLRLHDEGAEQQIRLAMRLFQKTNPAHAELAVAWTQLGRHYRARNQLDRAAQTLEYALEKWHRLDEKHPLAAEAMAVLADIRGQKGQVIEADKLYADALERHFSDLRDEDICRHFTEVLLSRDVYRPSDGEPRLNDVEAYLTEMIRRGGSIIEKALVESAKELTPTAEAPRAELGKRPHNLEVLTALRRLQKKRDPLDVEVKGPVRMEAVFPHVPDIAVSLLNQDERHHPIRFKMGGDYRGGRQERWRFDVRDAKGNVVLVRDRLDVEGGGLFDHAILKPGQRWHTVLEVSNFVELLPGDYTLRIQYHDDKEIAASTWLGGRIVCQSPELHLHIQPRVIDLAATEKKTIARLLEKLNDKGDVKILAGTYGKGDHEFIAPDSPAGQLLALGWKAVPQMIEESLNDITPTRQRAWMLGLLYSITTYHSPVSEDGVLPTFAHGGSGWSVWFGTDEAMSSGGMSWSPSYRNDRSKIVLSKQLEFARRWEAFREYIVVRTKK